MIWRQGTTDTVLASVDHHFEPPASGFDAVPFETDVTGIAADARDGDLLIWRFTALGTGGTGRPVFVPNGDGALAKGRIPSITLPSK